jgi:oligoribonuclease NrnB/cAMP/cGMP phosphodiesterase (DHH superfamily)
MILCQRINGKIFLRGRKLNNIKRKLFISHTDLDGIASIFLAYFFRKKLGFETFISRDYDFEEDSEEFSFLESFNEIVISDLSIAENNLKRLRDSGVFVEIYDHHEVASWLKEDECSVFSGDNCGTYLFWNYYVKPRIKRYPPILDYFVNLVDIYDIWRTEDPLWGEAKNLNSVLYGIKNYRGKELFDQIQPFIDIMEKKVSLGKKEWFFTEKEKRIIETSNEREEKAYKQAKETIDIRVDSKGKIFGLFVLPSKISLVASRILTEEPNIDYLVIINSWGGITGRISFRSRESFNCNDLYVANGHNVAAGATIDPLLIEELLKDSSLSFSYEEDYKKDVEKTIFVRV